ncbi:glucuronyl hydrolase [Mycena filopes]|nr:glucuronyl hydrolase [Mycena filopes]
MHSPVCLLAVLAPLVVAAQDCSSPTLLPLSFRRRSSPPRNLSLRPSNILKYTDTSAGHWLDFSPDTWTSGFFPATLYALNTRKTLCGATTANGLGAANWLTWGRSTSNGLIPLEAHNNQGHDVGFLSFPFVEELGHQSYQPDCSHCRQEFRRGSRRQIQPRLLDARGAGIPPDPTDFTVIIDNMMNPRDSMGCLRPDQERNAAQLSLLRTRTTTMKNHVRTDGSTWHVVEYNSTTGSVIRKRTSQGFSDSSTWSRGQAWGIYGFANMYSHIKDPNYLATARRMATYFLDNLPSDGIVPWDFNAPLVPAPRPADSSAATIAATGLLLLATVDTTPGAAKLWTNAAINLLNKITTLAWRPSWQSLLSNGTVNWPANNFLTGIVYGDYYYIKAGTELINMGLAQCS